MGTYDGLAIPAYGEYYRYDSSQGQIKYVEDSGETDITIVTDATAHDWGHALTITDTGAKSSGYGGGYYVAGTITGTMSGGVASNQWNAFASDITLDSSTAGAAGYGGGYIYISKSSDWANTSAVVYGFCLDIQEIGTVDYKCNLWLQNSSSTAAGVDAYILFSGQGTSGGTNSPMFYVQGITYPNYFMQLQTDAANGFLGKTAMGEATNSDGSIKIKAGANEYMIPIYAGT